MVTSRDVATYAKVSQATVSRVINGSGRTSSDVETRVREAIEVLGYVRNASATAMKTNRSRTVGIFISEMRNPFYRDLFTELAARLAAQKLRVMVWHAQEHADDAVDAINEKAVDALVISALNLESTTMMTALKSDRPIVLLNRIVEEFACDYVVGDNYAGSRKVADYLIAAERTDCLVIAGSLDTSTGRERLNGFLDGMRTGGAEVPDERIVATHFDADQTAETVREFVTAHGAPETVVCVNDAQAVAALNTLRELRIDVPETTWVVGYDNVWGAETPLIDLTTVSQSSQQMAEEAARILAARLDDPTLPWIQTVLPAELIVRGSTANFTPTHARVRAEGT